MTPQVRHPEHLRHPERSEGSPWDKDQCYIQEILHYVQDDACAVSCISKQTYPQPRVAV